MTKKMAQVVFLIFLSVSLFFCADDEVKNPQPDMDAAARGKIKPIANAGSDFKIILPVNSVQLDGSKSKDTVNSIKSYHWSQVAGPSSTLISNPSSSITKVSKLTAGSYTFRLKVTNNKNSSSYDDIIVSVSNAIDETSSTVTGNLFFQGNMSNVTITSRNNEPVFNGWDELKNHPNISAVAIHNIGKIPYALQEMRPDPVISNINTLYAQINDDDPNVSGDTRAQLSLKFSDGLYLDVYHTSHRMYLNPDIGHFTNYSSSITWFTLFEIWNRHVDGWDGSVSGSARWGLSINKDRGTGQPLHWRLKSDYMQPETVHNKDMWVYRNREIPIPLGQWFTLDLYMKRGEGTNGRMIVKITPDGGLTQVLFDVSNSTIYPGHPEIQLNSWQPFKLYLNDVYLDWMRANNKTISAYYNDFKWYQN